MGINISEENTAYIFRVENGDIMLLLNVGTPTVEIDKTSQPRGPPCIHLHRVQILKFQTSGFIKKLGEGG